MHLGTVIQVSRGEPDDCSGRLASCDPFIIFMSPIRLMVPTIAVPNPQNAARKTDKIACTPSCSHTKYSKKISEAMKIQHHASLGEKITEGRKLVYYFDSRLKQRVEHVTYHFIEEVCIEDHQCQLHGCV